MGAAAWTPLFMGKGALRQGQVRLAGLTERKHRAWASVPAAAEAVAPVRPTPSLEWAGPVERPRGQPPSPPGQPHRHRGGGLSDPGFSGGPRRAGLCPGSGEPACVLPPQASAWCDHSLPPAPGRRPCPGAVRALCHPLRFGCARSCLIHGVLCPLHHRHQQPTKRVRRGGQRHGAKHRYREASPLHSHLHKQRQRRVPAREGGAQDGRSCLSRSPKTGPPPPKAGTTED